MPISYSTNVQLLNVVYSSQKPSPTCRISSRNINNTKTPRKLSCLPIVSELMLPSSVEEEVEYEEEVQEGEE